MLVYTTFSSASPERFPGQLAAASTPGQTYRVGGNVVPGSVSRTGGVLRFKLGYPGTAAGKQIDVVYRGTVPDPFREGRDILIDVQQGATPGEPFVGQGNSLVTKCPSKFNGEALNATTPPLPAVPGT